jgi:hypothetical protein
MDSEREQVKPTRKPYDPAELSYEAKFDFDQMTREDLVKARYNGPNSKSITDADHNPIEMLDLRFGWHVLSLRSPEFDGKPDASAESYIDITDQFRGFKLKGLPELIDDGHKARFQLIGSEGEVLQIDTPSYGYVRGYDM